MPLKPSPEFEAEPTHSIDSGWTPNRNFTFSPISPTCLVSIDSDNLQGESNTPKQSNISASALSAHRTILKSASVNDLNLRFHNPFKPTGPSATRRRSSCNPLVIHPSPSRSSFLVGIECKFARTLSIVDEAMGTKRLPNRHCDPTSPIPPFSGGSAYPPSQMDGEDEQLLPPDDVCWDPNSTYDEAQQEDEKIPPKPFGVLKMEAIAVRLRSGNGWGVRSVYIAMCLLSTVTSIENNSLPVVEPYYLSLFGGHSALSTIGIITNIAWAVGKPPMSKVMDVFGRAEGVMIATVLYFFGATLTSSATSVTQYGIARIASALGSQGLQLAQMILVADTSSLASRALLTSTISSPWIFTTWVGPVIGARFKQMGEFGYRIIYAVFGILVPLCAMWLVGVLWWEWRALRRASASRYVNWAPPPINHTHESLVSRKKSHDVDSQHSTILSPIVQMPYRSSQRRDSQALLDDHCQGRSTARQLWTQTWSELDVIGILLLTLGFGMVLLPLSFGNNVTRNWAPGVFSGLLSGGILMLFIFSRYESKYASFPIIPSRLLKQRTIILGSSVCFWHFMCQYIYESYFTSFLQVVRLSSPRDAQYIQESYMFTACISALMCGVLVRWTRRYKIWVIVGVLAHSIGAMLMLRARNLDNPLTEIVISQVIAGFGGGFTTLASQLGVQAVVSHQDVGIATAVFLTVTQIGGAIGSSMAGAVWNSMLPSELRKRLPLEQHDKIDRIVGDLDYILSFPNATPIRESINSSYVEAQRMLNILALVALLPCLLSGLFMENVDLSGPSEAEPTSIPSERSSLLSPQREPTPSGEQLLGTSAI